VVCEINGHLSRAVMVNCHNRSSCGSYVLTRSPHSIKIFTKVRCNLDFPSFSEVVSGWYLPKNFPSDKYHSVSAVGAP
jgi:hypothetical protein